MPRAQNAFERFRLLRPFRGGQQSGGATEEDDFYVVHDNGTDEGPVDTEQNELVTYEPWA